MLFAMFSEHFLESFMAEVVGALVFGSLAIVMFIGAFKLFDKATPGIDFAATLHGQPYALAAVIIGFFFSIAYVMATVFHGR
jgi:cell division protein FtsX